MVGRPGRSKACKTCLKRHLRCGEEKPQCLRCRRRGTQCEYRATNFVFERDCHQSSSDLVLRPVKLSTDTTTKARDHWESQEPSLAISAWLSGVISDEHCVAFTLNSLGYHESPVELGWEVFHYASSKTSLTRECLYCLGKTYYARFHCNQRLLSEGTFEYGRMIKSLQSTLSDPSSSSSNETIATVALLALFEVCCIYIPAVSTSLMG